MHPTNSLKGEPLPSTSPPNPIPKIITICVHQRSIGICSIGQFTTFAAMLKKFFRILLRIIIAFFALSILSVIVFRFVPVPFTWLMLQRCVAQKLDGKEMHMEKDWVSLDQISNQLQLAVVASEDQNFLWHHGFDFEAIQKAMEYNEKQANRRHPKTRGASTISQQTAKNAFCWPARSFIRKGLEAYFTVLIEIFWSKERRSSSGR